MLTPENPIDLILRLCANGKEYKAKAIAASQGLRWEEIQAERMKRQLYDVARWKLIGNRTVGRAAP